MAPSLPIRRTDPEVSSGRSQVGLPLIGAARTDRTPTAGQDEGGDWILPLVRRAQERVMSQKDAVLTMGQSKTHYIEQLQGTGHLSIRRLGLLPEAFWLALIDEILEHFGVDRDSERLERALDGMQSCLSVIGQIARKAVTR